MENIQNKAQVRLVARAGRRTAERARRKRVTVWKSPSADVEKRLFDDDNAENYSPEKENSENSQKVILKNVGDSAKKKGEAKVKKTASFRMETPDQSTPTTKKKMPLAGTPAQGTRDKRKAKTPLSAQSACSTNSVDQSQDCISPFDCQSVEESGAESPPVSERKNFHNTTSPKKDKTKSKKKQQSQTHSEGFLSPNTFLRKHPYPQHYHGATPGHVISPKGSESDWEISTSMNESFGDLSLNDSQYDDDEEGGGNESEANSPNSVKSSKWCKQLNERIEAAGISGIENIPSHLRYISSYAEPRIEGESDLSEWEDVDDSDDSDESF